MDFRIGDAEALPLPDGLVDACRCERALQWVPDADQALAEMLRVLRPGGRLSIIDTDWRSLLFDLPDRAATDAVGRACWACEGQPSTWAGACSTSLVSSASRGSM